MFIFVLLLILLSSVNAFIQQSRILSKLKVELPSNTALNWAHHQAAEAGDLEFVMDHLAKHPADISDYDIDGQTMLHFACKKGHVPLAKFLIDMGPEFINFKNIRHRTPIYWAASYAGWNPGSELLAYYLIEKGADPRIQSKDCIDAFDQAKRADKDGKTDGKFHQRLKEAFAKAQADGVEIIPVALEKCTKRVYWG